MDIDKIYFDMDGVLADFEKGIRFIERCPFQRAVPIRKKKTGCGSL